MTEKLAFLDDELGALRDQGLFTTIRTLESPQGGWLTIDDRRVLNLCSNNYLGLANDQRLVSAAKSALDRYGIGPGAVRTIAGTMALHDELERKLAAFKGVEATISMQSGFTANLAVIPALTDRTDAIVSDALNHASIVDGVRLSRATRHVFRHRDVAHLDEVLSGARDGGARRILVITDGVFSMDGDLAPLPDIVEAADRHGAMVMVDDAHGEGVVGHGGRGIVDHFGLQGRVDVEVGTMSKAFGVAGGYIAGDTRLIEWLRQRARPFLFSSAVTPPDVAACIAAVDVLSESTELVDRLWANAARFGDAMKQAGFDTGHSDTPITPVIIGDESTAQAFSLGLFDDEDVFAQAIAYPTVAKGTARIRAMVSAAHSDSDIDRAVDAFSAVGRRLGVV